MEKKGNFFILLIIIALLTLIIAVLAAFIILVGVNQPTIAGDGSLAMNAPAPAPVSETLLSTLKLFPERQILNLRSAGGRSGAGTVDVSIKYINKVDGIKDVAAKIGLHEDNLREIVSNYFLTKTFEQVSTLEARLQAKEDLKDEMNMFLISTIDNEKDLQKVNEVVYEVVFAGWTFQQI